MPPADSIPNMPLFSQEVKEIKQQVAHLKGQLSLLFEEEVLAHEIIEPLWREFKTLRKPLKDLKATKTKKAESPKPDAESTEQLQRQQAITPTADAYATKVST